MKKLLAAAFVLVCVPARADQIDDYQRITEITLTLVREIAQAAATVCTAAAQDGYTRTDHVTETSKAATGKLVSLLLEAKNVNTVRQSDAASWRGILQSQADDSIQHTNECRFHYTTTTQNLVFIPFSAWSQTLNQAKMAQSPPPASSTPATEPKPPPTPAAAQARIPTGPTLRVFPKDNLTQRDLVLLGTVLSEYTIITGNSEVDKRHPADTLFVNRSKITIDEVLQVAHALAKLGVQIKSIQQSAVIKGREIQVGTAFNPDTHDGEFADRAPLNLAQLDGLRGPAFWRLGLTVSFSAIMKRGWGIIAATMRTEGQYRNSWCRSYAAGNPIAAAQRIMSAILASAVFGLARLDMRVPPAETCWRFCA